METQTIERVEQIGSLRRSVEEVKITSQDTYDRTVYLLSTVKGIMKDAPLVVRAKQAFEDANAAQKSTSRVWHTIWDPLVLMEQTCKAKLLQWDRAKQEEEDAKRRAAEAKRQADIRAEQDRLARESRERAAKEAAAAAAQAKRDGESKAAQERARKQAEADALARTATENAEKIADMHAAPMPEVRDAYARSAQVQTRDNWCWEFTDDIHGVQHLVQHVAAHPEDIYLLEPERLIETHPALNREAKSRKSMLKLPGGRAVNRGVVASRSV